MGADATALHDGWYQVVIQVRGIDGNTNEASNQNTQECRAGFAEVETVYSGVDQAIYFSNVLLTF